MKLTKELIEKAKTANTAEELLAMAKAETSSFPQRERRKHLPSLTKQVSSPMRN